MEFAEYEFRRNRKVSDGATEGDHLESGARQLANMPGKRRRVIEEIIPEAPPFPYELQYLFTWYIEITQGLPSGGFGPSLMTWEAIAAWQRLMDVGPLEPWEVKTLVDLGMLRARVSAETAEEERKTRDRKTRRDGPSR